MRQVLAPCAVGGLLPSVAPGDIVVPDQLVDRTSGRVQTYVERGAVHAPFADPYCARLSAAVTAADPTVKRGGAMVVIEGPRFSTRAESQSYAAAGWSLVNMTGHPEAVLARELRMCYSALALVTDMDAGVEAGEGVGQAEVFAMFAANIERVKGDPLDGAGRPPLARRLRLLRLGRRPRAQLRGSLITLRINSRPHAREPSLRRVPTLASHRRGSDTASERRGLAPKRR